MRISSHFLPQISSSTLDWEDDVPLYLYGNLELDANVDTARSINVAGSIAGPYNLKAKGVSCHGLLECDDLTASYVDCQSSIIATRIDVRHAVYCKNGTITSRDGIILRNNGEIRCQHIRCSNGDIDIAGSVFCAYGGIVSNSRLRVTDEVYAPHGAIVAAKIELGNVTVVNDAEQKLKGMCPLPTHVIRLPAWTP